MGTELTRRICITKLMKNGVSPITDQTLASDITNNNLVIDSTVQENNEDVSQMKPQKSSIQNKHKRNSYFKNKKMRPPTRKRMLKSEEVCPPDEEMDIKIATKSK